MQQKINESLKREKKDVYEGPVENWEPSFSYFELMTWCKDD